MRTIRNEPAVKSARRPKLSKRVFVFIAAVGLIVVTKSLMSRALPEFVSEPSRRTGSQHVPKPPTLTGLGAKKRLVESYGKTPLSFEMNQGQTDRRVKFLSRGSGYNLFLTSDEAVLAVQESGVSSQKSEEEPSSPFVSAHRQEKAESGRGISGKRQMTRHSTLRMKLIGANANAAVIGLDELPGKTNYFIGNDPKKWRTNVPTYAKVMYKGMYPGVDLVYYGNHEGQLEYDFVVSPGADPKAITFDIGVDGVTPVSSERRSPLRFGVNGDMLLHTDGGDVRFQKPVVYQEDHGRKHYIDGRYLLQAEESESANAEYPKSRISFEVAVYDRSKPLVIDPTIAYSTYLGGTTDSSGGTSIAVFTDPPTGHVYAYIAGRTCATDFPRVSAEQATHGGGCPGFGDVFVTKFDPAASGPASVIYSTYLGGSGSDAATGIAVDPNGNAYITGSTASTDFPTINAYHSVMTSGCFFSCHFAGTVDAFVAKLSATGSTLMYATYFGGSGDDNASAIALDAGGRAYIVGSTNSPDLPILNPFQATLNGSACGFPVVSQYKQTAFVAALDSTLSGTTSLTYCTYLGGSGSNGNGCDGDVALAVAVDSTGTLHLCGVTTSTNFPVINGFQTGSFGGAFYAKLNPFAIATAQLIYSTYLGGTTGPNPSNIDTLNSIALDPSGNAYVTGNGFVTKINPSLAGPSSLVYSIHLPASAFGSGIAVDASGNAFVVGSVVPGIGFVNAIQSTTDGVMQSVDAGQTWTALSQGLTDFPINALAVDVSTSPRTLYAGTGLGVFSSVDGGLNWKQVFQFPSAPAPSTCDTATGAGPAVCVALAVDPTTPSNVYAGTMTGVFKSSDRGATWSPFNTGLGSIASQQGVLTFLFDGNTLYAGAADGLYSLSPGASSWAPTGLTVHVRNIAVDPTTTPHTLYTASDFASAFKSTDGGAIWSQIDDGLGVAGISAIAVDASTTPSTLYAYNFYGALNSTVEKSADGGTSWIPLLDYFTPAPPGTGTILVDTTTSPSTVYVRDYFTGIYKSVDGGARWTSILWAGMATMAIDATTATGTIPITLYAGTSIPVPKALIAEISPSGSTIVFSTYLGGIASLTSGQAIALDTSDNVYVTGSTSPRLSPSNFPTVNAFQATVSTPFQEEDQYRGTILRPHAPSYAFFTKLGSQTLPASSPDAVTTQVGVQTGTLAITFPDISGSTTTGQPTLTVTPLSSEATANFSLSNNLGAYDISTTALYSGSITLCFQALTVNDLSTFNTLRLIHIVDGVPVDVTSSRNFSTRTVCGSATSLSPFILVNGMPTITWNNPSNIVYGTALGGAQLNATANVPGTFVYTPASGTIVGPGSGQNLSVTFKPTDTAIYATASKTVTINVLYAACNGGSSNTILQPINADGSSVFKLGSTVPTKFRVCDVHGVSVGLAGTVVSYQLVAAGSATGLTVDEQVYSSAGDTKFRWDSTAQQWILNQATGKNNTTLSQANTIYTFRINLKDGTYIQFRYGLK